MDLQHLIKHSARVSEDLASIWISEGIDTIVFPPPLLKEVGGSNPLNYPFSFFIEKEIKSPYDLRSGV